ncbi:MAG: hypothetical protein LBU10_04695 [Endomicrobium sp.]|nr:hypothetical protein [Endomicrobium sp.]
MNVFLIGAIQAADRLLESCGFSKKDVDFIIVNPRSGLSFSFYSLSSTR